MAGAVAFGYAAIFVTAPSPENLQTVFAFCVRGLKALKYMVGDFEGNKTQEHQDYEVIYAPGEEHVALRVNVFRSHRQTIQYIAPSEAGKLAQAELLFVDEAAAIPLPLTQALLGPYIVVLSSTITGYEGTGRSLSLKLLNELRKQDAGGGLWDGLIIQRASCCRRSS